MWLCQQHSLLSIFVGWLMVFPKNGNNHNKGVKSSLSASVSSIPSSVSPSSICYGRDGQRYRLIVSSASSVSKYPPILVLGGMAQSLSSWDLHIPALSKDRPVVIYECLGQGPSCPNDQDIINYRYTNVSLPFQAQKVIETLDFINANTINNNDDTSDISVSNNENDNLSLTMDTVDIVGFSFGARLAMAITCLYPNRIRKLHLTGVGSDRSDFGHLSLEAWKDSLRQVIVQQQKQKQQQQQLLRSFAWLVLLSTYASSFLKQAKDDDKLDRWITHIVQNNHPTGLYALLEQAEVNDKSNLWHVKSMARRITATTEATTTNNNNAPIITGQICIGELDQMAPIEMANELCQQLGWMKPIVISNCGHAVGWESPREWRNLVLKFLNEL